MKKFLGNIKKKSGSPDRNGSTPVVLPQGDSPEAVVVREVSAFCESGANAEAAGEEFLHLPAIVDAAESSPTASKEAAGLIRRYLSKEYNSRGFAQYNAVMLMRILTDNPARVFTQNFDAKFVSTIKELLRQGKDTSVQQILRETLDYLEAEKLGNNNGQEGQGNETLKPLVEMWQKEKGKRNTIQHAVGWGSFEAVGSDDHHTEHQQHQQHRAPPAGYSGHYQQPSRRHDVLPPAEELASRIEEAKTTARLLIQTVQSTPQSELLANDLVTEFAERARTAQRNMQTYMNCQNPAPDPDTMLTLIETNDHLNIAMSKHQRSLLQARKSNGLATPSPNAETEGMQNPMAMPQHNLGQNVYGKSNVSSDQGPYSVSPPRRQHTIPSPVGSPQRREEQQQYAAPPGPPPGARTQSPPTGSYDYAGAYSGASEPAPPIPTRIRPQSQVAAPAAGGYEVGENPFADDGYYGEGGSSSPPPKKSSNGLFDRGGNTPSPQPHELSGNQYIGELSGEPQQRPGPYNAEYQPTQSYMHRQDSSTAHITMHGGSAHQNPSSHPQSIPEYGASPVSPVDDAEGVGRRMNDLHI